MPRFEDAESGAVGLGLTGRSIAFNVELGFGGGTAPLIDSAFIEMTVENLAAAGYMMLGALM